MTQVQNGTRPADDDDIAVIGLAGRFPGARDISEFWRNLRGGVEGITFLDIDELRAAGVDPHTLDRPEYVRAASVLPDIDLFDGRFFGYNARDAALVDPQQRLFLECAWHALEDAGHAPGRLPGSVGVYGAANLSSYLLANLLAGRAGFATAGEALELLVANDKDYLTNRVGYHLGLDGPTIAVQTACSSSLVAVHMATQALLNGECDMALAGGVAVRVPHRTGYLYEEGLIFSPDGHCRPFDARAGGTVAGNGLGIVVLRRLADALADGDRIDAVVKGSAVNNDGREKIGYTAPGVDGQARVVATALGVADAEPESISAIEAHGTGTRLGDPIEITALTRVFGAGGGDRCAIGSVKSNIGHLDCAAGIAGFIKAVLQLRHRELVPSVNYSTPNPEIDFDRTPFYVNVDLTPWPVGAGPRRIGVSSFGMGGTNAHVVLQEAPARAPAPVPARPLHLLTLSARSTAAVSAGMTDLAGALRTDGPALADAAYTLRAGRVPLPHRRAVLCRDVEEATAGLTGRDPERVAGRVATDDPRVVWLFTGQGSQYPGMGRELYDAEPVFREQLDTCAALAREWLGLDLRDVLYPADPSAPAAAAALTRTALAQPALFAVEYSLAMLLRSWGLNPDVTLGHSVGEIVAACVAGAFTLRDALRLVSVRGRLMQQMPEGEMLSVALPEDDVRALLPDSLSIAASNAPELCVVSGPGAAISGFEQTLAARDVVSRRLHTSHAFHSAMMDPILEPFAAELATIPMQAPTIPFVSNVTGSWAEPHRVTEADYWVRHARETVRFGDAVDLLADGGQPLVLLEIGPGTTLGTLARQSPNARGAAIVPTLPAPGEDRSSWESVLMAVGTLWTAGVEPDWAAFQGDGRRVSLPGYPFQRRRYWVEPAVTGAPGAGLVVDADDGPEATPPGPHNVGDRDPRPEQLTEYVAPRNAIETGLVELWEELLGVAPVGVDDNFIEVGGHSLLAARMVDRVRDLRGVRVSLRDFLAVPTVARLAELTADGATPVPDTLPVAVVDRAALHEPFPLSEMQQAQWIGRMAGFQGGNIAAHVYWEVELAEPDLDGLGAAWNKVLQRHEMLRAVVLPDGTQRILPDVGRYEFDVLDLSTQDPATAAARLAELRAALSHEVRPADSWPLFDIRATLLPGGAVRLHLGFDLLIADIGSIRLLLRDWRRLYQDPGLKLPRPGLSYRDYVLALEAVRATPLYERAVAYWRDRVQQLPPPPDLPLAVAPSAVTDPEFTGRSVVVATDRWRRFTDRAAGHGLTPSAVLLAAYATALGTWSRSSRFCLNVTVINRLPVHPDVDDLVGEFASFDLLPVELGTADGIADLARRLQEQSWADLEHRYLNGVDVLRELARHRGGTSGSVMPIVFTSTLVQENDPEDSSMLSWLGETAHQIAQTPQVWLDFAVLATAGGIELTWHWVSTLFPAGLPEDVFEAFHGLMRDLADSETPWLQTPHLLPAAQRELVAAANATGAPVPAGLLFSPLLEQVERGPEQIAVIAEDGTLTYHDLHRHACRLAARLRSLGVGPDQLVAVHADKSREQIVAALGVQLAGGAYLPIDPELPPDRQDHLLAHGRARVVVTSGGDAGREWPDGIRVVTVDLADDPGEPVAIELVSQPSDLAYVIYTSGSTGLPKGVAIAHRAALNTVLDVNERFAVGPDDAVLGLSSLSFDLSVWDVFGVLGAGGTLVLPPADARRDPGRWLDLVHNHRVTIWNSVPPLAQMLADHAVARTDRPAPPLRLAMLSGDWIPLGLPAALGAIAPDIAVVSLGGATEASIWSIAHPIGTVDPTWDSIPYGRPMRNQSFQVFNDRFEPCPVWVTGELYIGGVGVAEGYWRDPERTAQSFVAHPVTGERLYRTGDLGRWRPDGTIEFLGREDFQVKIGGFRIELGEIESVLARVQDCHASVVAAVGTDRHHRRLVAYLVPAPGRGRAPDGDEALVELARLAVTGALPAYMVPAAFVVLDALPLSANGKVDRAALPEPGHVAAAPASAVDPARLDGLAERIAAIVADVVGLELISMDQNFFALGGDSITGVRIVSRANAEGMALTLQDLFEAPTVGALIAVLGERGADLVTDDGAGLPLTAHQRRLCARTAPEPPPGAYRVELDVGSCVTAERAGEALAALVARHDALRARVVPDGSTWTMHVTGRDGPPDDVPLIDLCPLPADRRSAAMAQMVAEMGDELDVERGPVVKAALFDLGGDRLQLALLVHELVADGPSWSTLLGEFFRLVGRLDEHGVVDLPPVSDSYASWARRLAPAGPATLASPAAAASAPPAAPGGTAHRSVTRLDAERTELLLRATATDYRMSLAEVAFASVVETLRLVTGAATARVDVFWDLRPAATPGTDVGRTVGPLSTVVTVQADLPATDPGELLAAAKQAHRRAAPSDTDQAGPAAAVLLRCLGRFGGDPGGDAHPLAESSPVAWPLPAGSTVVDHPVTATVLVAGGRLVLDWTATGPPDGADGAGFVERLGREHLAVVERLVAHCATAGAGDVRPSDFPLAGLDDRELAAVFADLVEEESL